MNYYDNSGNKCLRRSYCKYLILQNSSVTSVTLRGLHEWTHGQDVLTAQRAQHASGAA